MHQRTLTRKLMALGLALLFVMAGIGPALAAVWTDQADYAPGSTVYINGDGMLAGEPVRVDMYYPDGSLAQSHEVTASGSGTFSDTYVLPGLSSAVYGVYAVKATGLTSGNVYTITFVDGHSVSPSSLSFTATEGGANPASQTFTFSGPQQCNGGAVTDDQAWISVSPTSLPDYTTGDSTVITVSIAIAGLTADGSPYSGSVTVDPDDAGPSADEPCDSAKAVSINLTINPAANTAPTVGSISGPTNVTEADHGVNAKTYSVTASDPDVGDTVTYAWSITAGNSGASISGATNSSSVSVDFTDGPTNPVTLQVVVGDGHAGHDVTRTLDINEANVAPTIAISGAASVNEGSLYTLNLGAITDPGADTVTAYTIDWDDGTVENFSAPVSPSKTHTYADGPNNYTITVDLTDEDGTFVSAGTKAITVNNVPPTIVLTGNSSVNEGSLYTLNLGAITDPGTDTVTAYIVHWGDGLSDTYGTNGVKTHTYTDDNPTGTPSDVYAITVDLVDEDGTFLDRANALSVTVNNVAPTVGAITAPLDPVQVNISINASASFTDPGILDTHTAVWNWGDGNNSTCSTTPPSSNPTAECAITGASGSWSANGSHTYTAAGIYTLTLTVTDDDGGPGQSTFQYVVVYDPSAGFVTGGGWINSPEGAYTADASLTGKANFGFVSKYVKGATVPTGNTEFQFKAGNLNFKSTSYDWLVVQGGSGKAQYKGSGTINGAGDYGFMLTVSDGGTKGDDKFRIKIWDKNTDAVVYDNQLGAADDADATTAISGGSIVIHK